MPHPASLFFLFPGISGVTVNTGNINVSRLKQRCTLTRERVSFTNSRYITSARFFRNPRTIDELKSGVECGAPESIRFTITKVLTLSPKEYRHFCSHLSWPKPYIEKNQALMGANNQLGTSDCLLLTTRQTGEAVLLDCGGYDYDRYIAYVADKQKLDLHGVPVERYDAKPRKPRSETER